MVLEQLTLFPEDFLVSPLATQEREKERLMTVIYGLKCGESSKSADRLGLLLKMLEGSSAWHSQIGSLCWKTKDLPKKKRKRCSKASGKILKTWGTGRSQSLFQLARSGHRTKDSESSSLELWGTPNAADSTGSHGGGQSKSLRTDIYNSELSFWATPQARDYRSGDDPTGPRAARKIEQGWTQNLNDQVKLWPTPRANDPEKRGRINAEDPRNGLPGAVRMWPTPAAQDSKNATLPASQADRDTVPGAVIREGHTGQLNPNWVEALMCLPDGWTDIDSHAELPPTLAHPNDYVEYIRNHRQPALIGQPQHDWEPPRVSFGIKGRVSRLKMLGNGVVPIQILPIVAIIAMIELEA